VRPPRMLGDACHQTSRHHRRSLTPRSPCPRDPPVQEWICRCLALDDPWCQPIDTKRTARRFSRFAAPIEIARPRHGRDPRRPSASGFGPGLRHSIALPGCASGGMRIAADEPSRQCFGDRCDSAEARGNGAMALSKWLARAKKSAAICPDCMQDQDACSKYSHNGAGIVRPDFSLSC
jgi:hypothetical protein